MTGKRSFFDIATGELAKVYLPGGDTPANRRFIRKLKSGERRLLAADIYVLARVIPSLDVAATLARAYELEELRKRKALPTTPLDLGDM